MRSWQGEPGGLVDPDEVRRTAEEILSRPEYREPQPSLLDRALEAITDFLGRSFAALTGGGAGSIIGLVITALVLALALWLLAKALRTSWSRSPVGDAVGVVQGTSAPDDPAVWDAEAERLAAAGDHRGALRCRYQALVADLVRRGAVDDVAARTPAELRRELTGRQPALDPVLDSVTERFEGAWYGGRSVDAGALDAFRADVDALRTAELRPAVRS
ncbi:DUF4129 domain-containing protein [Acidimicrobiia bacterium EGI L10123]|uniref:DUF4129 domain-containing protein n=1 Tax=Salinilacustrithrix flava TaxID=2957203 RepID=UPI003D7C3544|nr:DUF4129 domain-containing protein [Acidimicrobiia bacterium EGI L10123]